ncbi:MAG: hypothetical protein WDN49_00895 [Acetobacteraceae bacterium]
MAITGFRSGIADQPPRSLDLPDGPERASSLIRKNRCQEGDEDHGAGEQEGAANPDQRRKTAADQWTDEIARHDAGREHPERPAGPGLGGLRRDKHHRAGGIAAQQSGEQAKTDQLPDVRRHADQRHGDGHAEAGADHHQLAAVEIGQPAPERRDQGRGKERGAVGNARPLHDGGVVLNPELLHV